MAILQQDVDAYLGEDIIIETTVDLTGTGLTDLTGFTATFEAAQQNVAVPDTVSVAGVIAGAVITVTVPAADVVEGKYAHQLKVTDGIHTYIVMVGWLSVTDWLNDASGIYFTVDELRAFDTEFADATAYPTATIETARTWAQERFETASGAAFVSRSATHTSVGTGDQSIFLPHMDVSAITAASVGGAALSATELAALIVYPHGQVYRSGGWAAGQPVSITYTYGKTTVPAPVKTAVMLLAKEYLVTNNLGDRKTSESTDVGFVRFSVAAPGGKTGIPEVDAVIADYGHGKAYVL